MACKVVVGNVLNDDLASSFATNNSFSADFGAAFAHDGPGKMAAAYAADAAPGDPIIDFGLNLVRVAAINWTAVVGTVADSADQDHGADSSSLKVLVNVAHIDSAELTVRSGYSYWLEGWGFGSGTGPEAKISLYNPNTKHWWNGSAWVSTIAYVLTGATAASWVGIGAGAGIRVDVEAQSETLAPTTTVQVQLWRIGNATADPVYFDDIFLYQGIDFVGLFGGNNVPPWVDVTWKTISSTGTPTAVGTFTKARNQFFLTAPAIVFGYEHVIKFDIGGTTISPPIWFGDCVVGKTISLSKAPNDPIQIQHQWAGQARQEAPGGARYIANRGPAPVRTLTLNFRFINAAQEAEALQVWLEQVRGGEESVVVMPSTVKYPNLAIYGDLSASQGLSVSLVGGMQTGVVTGDMAGTGSTQEHYSDMTLVVEEGAIFTMDT